MFFSWLGVTQYLSPAVVLGTLREIAEMATPGSEIVFQFVVPAATLTPSGVSLVMTLADSAAAAGEPWLSFFEPGEMEAHLRQRGFGRIRHFGPEQAHERYLAGRADGLRLPAYFHMINAVVDGATED